MIRRQGEGPNLSRKCRARFMGMLIAPLFFVFLATVPALAQVRSAEGAEVAQEAIGQLRSPYCPGFMLEVCPSVQAEALRDSIYDLASAGMTSDEIVEWMIGNHGEEWRGLPKRSGAGLLAWVMPPLALLLGVAAFLFWLKSSRNKGTREVALPDGGITQSDRAELAAALQNWEETGAEEP